MSNRRKVRPPRPQRIEKLVVDAGDYDTAVRGLQAVRACAACHGRAHVVGGHRLQIQHAPDCPALDDPSLIMEVNR